MGTKRNLLVEAAEQRKTRRTRTPRAVRFGGQEASGALPRERRNEETHSDGPQSAEDRQENALSSKHTLKFEIDNSTGENVHLYEETLDKENVFLELNGCVFGATSSPQVVVRIGNLMAEKLGLIPVGSRTKRARRRPTSTSSSRGPTHGKE